MFVIIYLVIVVIDLRPRIPQKCVISHLRNVQIREAITQMKHLLHVYCNHLGREHLCRSDWSQWHCRCYVLVFLVCTLKLSVV